MTQTVV